MKILVCIKSPRYYPQNCILWMEILNGDTNGVQFIINPYDEWYALIRAPELKKSNGGSVTV